MEIKFSKLSIKLLLGVTCCPDFSQCTRSLQPTSSQHTDSSTQQDIPAGLNTSRQRAVNEQHLYGLPKDTVPEWDRMRWARDWAWAWASRGLRLGGGAVWCVGLTGNQSTGMRWPTMCRHLFSSSDLPFARSQMFYKTFLCIFSCTDISLAFSFFPFAFPV